MTSPLHSRKQPLREAVRPLTLRVSKRYEGADRGVAQSGSVLAWGASGRPFKSAHPDHIGSVRRGDHTSDRLFFFSAF